MDLYDYLVKTYGYNEPIFTKEIHYKDYSCPWLQKELCQLCEDGKLVRYDKGVYYAPESEETSDEVLDPYKVILKKYIQRDEETIGYFSGKTLLNMLGLTEEVPESIEIYTNNEKTKIREKIVGDKAVTLRRARTEINRDNVDVLQFLELMNYTCGDFFDDDRREKVVKHIQDKGLSRKMLTEYAPVFPDRAMRTLVESELIYSIVP